MVMTSNYVDLRRMNDMMRESAAGGAGAGSRVEMGKQPSSQEAGRV